MSYRNKTYVAFASEDISSYRLMEAWRDNAHIDFNFYDAHDIYGARDSSTPETIKRRLRERLNNAKQVVLLASPDARRKGGDGVSFLAHEIKVIQELNLPLVIANLNQSRLVDGGGIPNPLITANYTSVNVSFQPKIIMRALDDCIAFHAAHPSSGAWKYEPVVYSTLGL
ncbi:TPA: TIR domain-containing protein [Stenotrophomonas maltophilia]|nr:TIR domain-containing protein [Stenotrophomonas maltophilia]